MNCVKFFRGPFAIFATKHIDLSRIILDVLRQLPEFATRDVLFSGEGGWLFDWRLSALSVDYKRRFRMVRLGAGQASLTSWSPPSLSRYERLVFPAPGVPSPRSMPIFSQCCTRRASELPCANGVPEPLSTTTAWKRHGWNGVCIGGVVSRACEPSILSTVVIHEGVDL